MVTIHSSPHLLRLIAAVQFVYLCRYLLNRDILQHSLHFTDTGVDILSGWFLVIQSLAYLHSTTLNRCLDDGLAQDILVQR